MHRHEKSAGTAGVPGEHFLSLGNILDQNLRCFVAFYSLPVFKVKMGTLSPKKEL